MKKIIIIIFGIILLSGCTKVVDIPLDTANPKLVVEANIYWAKGTSGNVQKIKLSKTADFYTNITPKVSSAIVTITNSSNTIFNFIEVPNTGEYVCNNFVPALDAKYTLNIASEGKNYTATETLKPVVAIQNIIQNNNGGFSQKQIQLNAIFNDPIISKDFYLFKYKYPSTVKPDFYVSDDKFYNGNEFFSNSFNNKLEIGNSVEITHYGITEQYYNYLNILLNLAGNQGGGPFQAPPVSVRGNIINLNDSNDFPFGYFSLSETDSRVFVIQ